MNYWRYCRSARSKAYIASMLLYFDLSLHATLAGFILNALVCSFDGAQKRNDPRCFTQLYIVCCFLLAHSESCDGCLSVFKNNELCVLLINKKDRFSES